MSDFTSVGNLLREDESIGACHDHPIGIADYRNDWVYQPKWKHNPIVPIDEPYHPDPAVFDVQKSFQDAFNWS